MDNKLINKYINEEEDDILMEDLEASIDKFLDKIFQKKSIPNNKKKKIKSKFKTWWTEMAGEFTDDD